MEQVPPPSNPPMEGTWIRLRPVTEEDYGYLFDLATDHELAYRWRYRGVVPSPEAFVQSIWHGVFSQFIVTLREDGSAIGHVLGQEADAKNGHAAIAIICDPAFAGTGMGIEALLLLSNYLFATWPFRKLYMEVSEFNLEQFKSAVDEFLHVEGQLKEHQYFDGRYWDTLYLALYREEFLTKAQRFLERRGARPMPR